MSISRLIFALLLVLLAGPAAAQEGETCSGEEIPIQVTPAPAATGPRWADLGLSIVVVVVGVLGAARLRRLPAGERAAPGPTLAGAAAGVLFALSLLVLRRPIGMSGGFAHLARGDLVSPAVAIVLGVVAGAALAAAARGHLRPTLVPAAWAALHGPSVAVRAAVVFVGAILLEVASLVAGGCTSGLALSGGVALAPGAFVFMAAMFATGVPAAWLAHRRGRPS